MNDNTDIVFDHQTMERVSLFFFVCIHRDACPYIGSHVFTRKLLFIYRDMFECNLSYSKT